MTEKPDGISLESSVYGGCPCPGNPTSLGGDVPDMLVSWGSPPALADLCPRRSDPRGKEQVGPAIPSQVCVRPFEHHTHPAHST